MCPYAHISFCAVPESLTMGHVHQSAWQVYMHKFASRFLRSPGARMLSLKGNSRGGSAKTEEEDSDDTGETGRGFQEVVKVIRSSDLADKTKGDVPSPLRVEVCSFSLSVTGPCGCSLYVHYVSMLLQVTFRNINWILQYWGCAEPTKHEEGDEWDYSGCYPDPVCNEYGFARKDAAPQKKKKSGKRKGPASCCSSSSSILWLDEMQEACSSGGDGEK